MQRAKAGMIAGKIGLFPAAIPDYKGKFAVDMRRALIAPPLIGAQHQFSVGTAAQHRAAGQQLRAQFFKIDLNSDMSLSQAELGAALEQLGLKMAASQLTRFIGAAAQHFQY